MPPGGLGAMASSPGGMVVDQDASVIACAWNHLTNIAPVDIHLVAINRFGGQLYHDSYSLGSGTSSSHRDLWLDQGSGALYLLANTNRAPSNFGYRDVTTIKYAYAVGLQEPLGDSPGSFFYPNPLQEHSRLRVPGCSMQAVVGIYDLNGRWIRTFQPDRPGSFSITRDHLRPGIYFFRVLEGGKLTCSGKFQVD
jgi:hypothetical protein